MIRRSREIDLHGKTVLITGGSRGLGLVLAREFAREGAQVAVCARDEGELIRAIDDLGQRGARAVAIRCDVGNHPQVEHMVQLVQERLGPIDVLVNNAGIIEVGPMEEMNLQDYAEAMQTNFWAPLFASMAVLPQMRARGEGRIVNIASIGGKIALPHLLPYTASKFALVGLSEGMRAELAQAGIRVTTVCPGLMPKPRDRDDCRIEQQNPCGKSLPKPPPRESEGLHRRGLLSPPLTRRLKLPPA